MILSHTDKKKLNENANFNTKLKVTVFFFKITVFN